VHALLCLARALAGPDPKSDPAPRGDPHLIPRWTLHSAAAHLIPATISPRCPEPACLAPRGRACRRVSTGPAAIPTLVREFRHPEMACTQWRRVLGSLRCNSGGSEESRCLSIPPPGGTYLFSAFCWVQDRSAVDGGMTHPYSSRPLWTPEQIDTFARYRRASTESSPDLVALSEQFEWRRPRATPDMPRHWLNKLPATWIEFRRVNDRGKRTLRFAGGAAGAFRRAEAALIQQSLEGLVRWRLWWRSRDAGGGGFRAAFGRLTTWASARHGADFAICGADCRARSGLRALRRSAWRCGRGTPLRWNAANGRRSRQSSHTVS